MSLTWVRGRREEGEDQEISRGLERFEGVGVWFGNEKGTFKGTLGE